jgi:hypothetical protein
MGINECTQFAHDTPKTRINTGFYVQSIIGATERRRLGSWRSAVGKKEDTDASIAPSVILWTAGMEWLRLRGGKPT